MSGMGRKNPLRSHEPGCDGNSSYSVPAKVLRHPADHAHDCRFRYIVEKIAQILFINPSDRAHDESARLPDHQGRSELARNDMRPHSGYEHRFPLSPRLFPERHHRDPKRVTFIPSPNIIDQNIDAT